MTAFVTFPDLPSLLSVPSDALVAVWTAGGLYAAPASAFGGGGGGGGGGGYSTVESNGSPLTQRTNINVTGLLTASDSGGKTIISLAAIALASQVSGVLPIANGGLGLSTLGTAGQSLRVNAGATGYEAYTPSAGLNAPVSPTDNNKVAVASSGNLVYSLLVSANLSPTAGLTLAQHANIQTDRLIGRDTAASGAPEELTVGGNLEFTGTGGIQRGALTGAVTAPAGSGVTTLAAGSAKGQYLEYSGSAWGFTGVKTKATDLPDSDITIALSDGSRALLTGVITATRAVTLSNTGAVTKKGYIIEKRLITSFSYQVKDATAAVLYTFAAADIAAACFVWNGAQWEFSVDYQLV